MLKLLSAKSNFSADLYTAQQVQDFDALACKASTEQQQQTLGFALMQQAGRTAYQFIQRKFSQGVDRICVLAGRGNNGGDGYVIATLAKLDGVQAIVIEVGEQSANTHSTNLAREQAKLAEVEFVDFKSDLNIAADLYVDALLGTGLSVAAAQLHEQGKELSEIRQPMAGAINWLNAQQGIVLAMDVPSGLCADTGRVLGQEAVQADLTITFIAMKQGLLTHDGPDYCGGVANIELAQLLPERDGPIKSQQIYQQHKVSSEHISFYRLAADKKLFTARQGNSHKGSHGRVMLVAGEAGYAGAAIMAAQSALMSGAGLIACATRSENAGLILTSSPEVMARGIDSGLQLENWRNEFAPQVIMIGPGLGQQAWADLMLQQAFLSAMPDQQKSDFLVLDADALNLLAKRSWQKQWQQHQQPFIANQQVKTVITPHPAEAARLLGCSVTEVQKDRFKAVQQLANQYNAVVILKGQGSLLAAPDYCQLPVQLTTDGNAAMATGGMGDILAGCLTAVLAQLLNQDCGLEQNQRVIRAAQIAMCAHSAAADMYLAEHDLQQAMVGLKATELLPYIRRLLNFQHQATASLLEDTAN